jgi:hypothetical protein
MCEHCQDTMDGKYRPDLPVPRILCEDCYETEFEDFIAGVEVISAGKRVAVPSSRQSERYENRKYGRRMKDHL